MNRDKEHCKDSHNECPVIRYIEDVLQVKLLPYQKLLVIHVFETNECKHINLCSYCRTKMEKKMDDTVSRQQEIDALWAERMKHAEEMERNLETCSFALRADNKARRNRVEEDIEIIRQLPPAEPKRGKWKNIVDGIEYTWGTCDSCGARIPMPYKYYKYCSNCGADMREVTI